MIDTINDDLWNNMTSYLQNYTEKITLKDICDDYRQRLDNQEAQFMYYICQASLRQLKFRSRRSASAVKTRNRSTSLARSEQGKIVIAADEFSS